MSEPQISVREYGYQVLLTLDDDGTPIVPSGWDCGERMIEVEPGIWQEPTMVAIDKYLREHVGALIAKPLEPKIPAAFQRGQDRRSAVLGPAGTLVQGDDVSVAQDRS
jgi:hypothetical protein